MHYMEILRVWPSISTYSDRQIFLKIGMGELR
jgi:hypothetical protein